MKRASKQKEIHSIVFLSLRGMEIFKMTFLIHCV